MMAGAGDDEEKQPARKRRSGPDWSDLPPSALRLISSSIANTWDHIRFRGVCSSWRSTGYQPPRTPSLLLPYDPATAARSFFNLSDRTVHTIHLPESRRKCLYGTPYGWLVMLGKEEMVDGWLFTVSLINPITKAQIMLPPLPREITWLPELQSAGVCPFSHCTKPVLTGSPTPTVFLALLIVSDLAICPLGVGGAWAVVNLLTPCSLHRVMLDLAYFDGAFYAVDDTKGITTVSTNTLKKQYSSPPQGKKKYSSPPQGPTSIPEFNALHLMESSGDLLLLEIFRGVCPDAVLVSKLDRCNNRKPSWVRVNASIGGRALFVSSTHSSLSQPSLGFVNGWGSDVVCFTGVDRKNYEKYGAVGVIIVCISDIVVAGRSIKPYTGRSINLKPYYWQHTWRDPSPRGLKIYGLTWMLPCLQQIEYDDSLSLDMNQMPSMVSISEDNDPAREVIEASRWPDLPTDVLLFVSRKLSSPWDYVRFRGVCSTWRLAACPGYRQPPQRPSVLLPYDIATTTRSFLDLSDSQVLTMDITEARGKWLYGTPYGWLVMLGEQDKEDGWMFSVTLLNPVTRALILLPQLPREITRLPEQQNIWEKNNNSSKPILSGHPVWFQGCTEVFLGLLIFSRLVFCRLGQGETWTVVDLSIPRAPRRVMVEFTYFDGAFYIVDVSKGITVISTNPLKKKYLAPPSTRPVLDCHSLHLVELFGDLLLLEIHKTRDKTVVELEKLDRSTKKLKWVRANEGMKGCALFVSHNHSSISLCPHNSAATATAKRFICFASDESKYDGNFGNVDIATVCISFIDSDISIGGEPYYWQGSRRDPTYGRSFLGLTWFIPSPS